MDEFTVKAMLKMTAHYAEKAIDRLEKEDLSNRLNIIGNLEEVRDAMDKTVEAIDEYLPGLIKKC